MKVGLLVLLAIALAVVAVAEPTANSTMAASRETRTNVALPSNVKNCGDGWFSKILDPDVDSSAICTSFGYTGIDVFGGNSGTLCSKATNMDGHCAWNPGHATCGMTVDWHCTGKPPPAPLKTGAIRSKSAVKCLDVPGNNVNNGNKMWLWDCNGLPEQMWYFGGGRLFLLSNKNKCLDLPGNDPSNGNQLEIWDCNSLPQQNWAYDTNSKAIYLSSSGGTRKCLDVKGGGQKAPVQLWDCSGDTSQQWEVFQYGATREHLYNTSILV